MDCASCRELVSAIMDDAGSDLDVVRARRHLGTCSSCCAWCGRALLVQCSLDDMVAPRARSAEVRLRLARLFHPAGLTADHLAVADRP